MSQPHLNSWTGLKPFWEHSKVKSSAVLDKLEASVQSQRQVSTPRVPHPTNSLPLRPPLADVNSQQVSAATDAKIQALLVNPRITGPVHLASELAKLIFTEKEMAACTLTGRKINGQCRQMLDSGKMCLIEHLVQQKFSMGEAEFASVRSGIRDSLANRCKYLRLKLAPRNIILYNCASTNSIISLLF